MRKPSKKELHRKRTRILAEMGEVTELVRGSLTKQYLTRLDATGKPYQAGPYYVRTWYIEPTLPRLRRSSGKIKKCQRIPSDQVRKVEQQVRNYQKLKDLFDDLLDVTEQMTLTL